MSELDRPDKVTGIILAKLVNTENPVLVMPIRLDNHMLVQELTMLKSITVAILILLTAKPAIAELPRTFGSYHLGMPPEQAEKILGHPTTGTCASCVKDENVYGIPDSLAVNLFKDGFNIDRNVKGVNLLMFYRGTLYAIRFSLPDNEQQLLQLFTSKFGKPKKVTVAAKGICVATDSYTWSGSRTTLTLTLYPQQNYSGMLVISDKAINAKIEKLQPYEKIECE